MGKTCALEYFVEGSVLDRTVQWLSKMRPRPWLSLETCSRTLRRTLFCWTHRCPCFPLFPYLHKPETPGSPSQELLFTFAITWEETKSIQFLEEPLWVATHLPELIQESAPMTFFIEGSLVILKASTNRQLLLHYLTSPLSSGLSCLCRPAL